MICKLTVQAEGSLVFSQITRPVLDGWDLNFRHVVDFSCILPLHYPLERDASSCKLV